MRKFQKCKKTVCAWLLLIVMSISPVLSVPVFADTESEKELKEYREGLFARYEEYLAGFDSYEKLTNDSVYSCSLWARAVRYVMTEVDYTIENAEEKSFWEKVKEFSAKLDHNAAAEISQAVTWAGHVLTDTQLNEEAYVEYLSRIVAMHEKGFLETAATQAEYTVKVNVGMELLEIADTVVETAWKNGAVDKIGIKIKDLCGEETFDSVKDLLNASKELKDKVSDLNLAIQSEAINFQDAYSLALYASLHQEKFKFLQVIYDNADPEGNKELRKAAKTLMDAASMEMAGLLLMDEKERVKNLSKIVSTQTGLPDVESCVQEMTSYVTTAATALAGKIGGATGAALAKGISFLGSNASLIVAGFQIGGHIGRIFMGDEYESYREMLIMDEIASVLSKGIDRYQGYYVHSKNDEELRYKNLQAIAAAGEALCYVRLRGEYTACEYLKGRKDSPSDEELDQKFENTAKRLNRYHTALNQIFPEPPKQVVVYADREYKTNVIADGYVISDIVIPTVYIEGNDEAAEKINESQIIRDIQEAAKTHAKSMAERVVEYSELGMADAWGPLMSSADLQMEDAGIVKQGLSMMIKNINYYPASAHSDSAVYCCNFDTKTGERLLLADILEKDADMTDVLAEAFQKMEDGEALLEWGRTTAKKLVTDSFLNAEESLRERHWYLSSEGFNMMFDAYQVGPYAAGNVKATVPWEKLSGIVKSEYMPESIEAKVGQGTPKLMTEREAQQEWKGYSDEANLHLYGSMSRSFWGGFTNETAYEVKMESRGRMIFYANYMTVNDAVCFNDSESDTAKPDDGGIVSYMKRDEGTGEVKRFAEGYGKAKPVQ